MAPDSVITSESLQAGCCIQYTDTSVFWRVLIHPGISSPAAHLDTEPTWDELWADVGQSGPGDCGMAEAAAGVGRHVEIMGVRAAGLTANHAG